MPTEKQGFWKRFFSGASAAEPPRQEEERAPEPEPELKLEPASSGTHAAVMAAVTWSLQGAQSAAESPESLAMLRRNCAHLSPDSPLMGDALNLNMLEMAEKVSACRGCGARMPDPEEATAWVQLPSGGWACGSCAASG